MIELKRLKLINWHNFENVTFDCARLTYMIGVNAVGIVFCTAFPTEHTAFQSPLHHRS